MNLRQIRQAAGLVLPDFKYARWPLDQVRVVGGGLRPLLSCLRGMLAPARSLGLRRAMHREGCPLITAVRSHFLRLR